MDSKAHINTWYLVVAALVMMLIQTSPATS
jgi:hypothetical protein